MTRSRTRTGVDSTGKLCGTLRSAPNSQPPAKGDDFRFVSVQSSKDVEGNSKRQVVIYGDVVD